VVEKLLQKRTFTDASIAAYHAMHRLPDHGQKKTGKITRIVK
jgi:hypothetical protein